MYDPNVEFPGAGWKLWSPDDRPPEHLQRTPLRWLVVNVQCLGRRMAVEWTDKQSLCGMGYGDSEWWPPGSTWNGYTRRLLADYWWHELPDGDDAQMRCIFHGLDLLPCPFTGNRPVMQPSTRYIGAPPFLVERVTLSSWIAKVSESSADVLEQHWNRRPV